MNNRQYTKYLFEKIQSDNGKFQNIYNGLYDDFKRE